MRRYDGDYSQPCPRAPLVFWRAFCLGSIWGAGSWLLYELYCLYGSGFSEWNIFIQVVMICCVCFFAWPEIILLWLLFSISHSDIDNNNICSAILVFVFFPVGAYCYVASALKHGFLATLYIFFAVWFIGGCAMSIYVYKMTRF